MCVVPVLDFDNVIYNFDLRRIAAENIRRIRESSFDVIRRPVACAHIELTNGAFRGAGEIQSLGHLGADYITLVHRNSDRGEDADDCHDDHELNQREAALVAGC